MHLHKCMLQYMPQHNSLLQKQEVHVHTHTHSPSLAVISDWAGINWGGLIFDPSSLNEKHKTIIMNTQNHYFFKTVNDRTLSSRIPYKIMRSVLDTPAIYDRHITRGSGLGLDYGMRNDNVLSLTACFFRSTEQPLASDWAGRL